MMESGAKARNRPRGGSRSTRAGRGIGLKNAAPTRKSAASQSSPTARPKPSAAYSATDTPATTAPTHETPIRFTGRLWRRSTFVRRSAARDLEEVLNGPANRRHGSGLPGGDHRRPDQLSRVDRRLVGGAVLAPEGLHAGLHDGARRHGEDQARGG